MATRSPKTQAVVQLGDPKAQQVLEAAQAGDVSVLPTIREWLANEPALLDSAGNLAAIAERKWADRVAGKNLLVREAIAAQLAALKLSLGGPAPSPLERLLIERVATCWLQVSYFESMQAQKTGGHTFRQAEFDLKCQGAAQRRYLAAIRTLAEVRKLLGPTIQVNIAEQQVNVAATRTSS